MADTPEDFETLVELVASFGGETKFLTVYDIMEAESLLDAMEDAGLVVVPVDLTDEMLHQLGGPGISKYDTGVRQAQHHAMIAASPYRERS